MLIDFFKKNIDYIFGLFSTTCDVMWYRDGEFSGELGL